MNLKRSNRTLLLNGLLIALSMVTRSSSTAQSSTSLQALAQKRAGLEQQLEQRRASGRAESDPDMKQIEEQLLEATGKEDAALQDIPPSAKAAGATTVLSIPVYFATDRVKSVSGDYTGDFKSDGLDVGTAVTTLNVPYGVRADLIYGAHNLAQNFGIKPPQLTLQSGMADLLKNIEVNKTDPNGRGRKVLLFVHGYNVSFTDAVTAAARLATEVQFPVIPVAYSWPSNGTLSGYWHDEDMVRASNAHFLAFLHELLEKSGAEVVIVCHSMGAREVTSALAELGRNGAGTPALRKVVYAAGDISSGEFLSAWADVQKLRGVGFSFYASSHDLPLRLSHIVHQTPRLGDASPVVVAPLGGLTIDASLVDSIYQALGHSYILNSPRVGADLGTWIDVGTGPRDRGLTPISVSGQSYFLLR